MINVLIWNEYRQEKTMDPNTAIYPNGIHETLKEVLQDNEFSIKTATLDEPEHGLTEEVIKETDVMLWWGHWAHEDVSDKIVQRVYDAVQGGMGLIVLHSAHYSKIFKKLMGTSCNLSWRDIGERERVWCINPSHPIAKGVPSQFELLHEEMYGEPFGVPNPDEVVFSGWFEGGNVFRSGLCYNRGYGKIFYFQPGHETYPNYKNENIITILKNAIKWAKQNKVSNWNECTFTEFPLEPIKGNSNE